jgi:hypothetical protein
MTDKRIIHGLSSHPMYKTLRNMVERCYNEYSKYYIDWGGRGIKINKRYYDPDIGWPDIEGLENFILDMSLLPEEWLYRTGWCIDRIDNNEDYEPGNIRFAPYTVSNFNKRNNIWITDENGNYILFKEYYEKYGHPSVVDYLLARKRLTKYNWSPKDSIRKPKHSRQSKIILETNPL